MMGRRILLAGLSLVVFASQAIWITFSPVGSLVAGELGVLKEMVGLLALVYPVVFLALTLPSGLLLDRGFKAWLSIGAYLTVLGGVLRLVFPSSYWWLLACQVLAAIGQPFLLNSFAPFASRFYPDRRDLAVSVLSFSMYLGIIYGLGTGYYMYTRYGLEALIAPIAGVSLLGGALYTLGALERWPPDPPRRRSIIDEVKAVARIRELWLLGSLLGLGVALFDNMSIWLETALSSVGLGDVAGVSVALSLVLGLAGVTFIPSMVARAGARTLYLRMASIVAVVVYAVLAVEAGRITILTLIPLLGLVMLPAYPVVMEWISTFHPKEIHGGASGFIGLVSRLFTVTLASAAVLFTGSPGSYFAFLALLALAAVAIALMLPRR